MKIMCPIDQRVLLALGLKPGDVQHELLANAITVQHEFGDYLEGELLRKLQNKLTEEKQKETLNKEESVIRGR